MSQVQIEEPRASTFPSWETAELPPAPIFRARQWTGLIGPGLLMAGANIGGGEWTLGPLVTAQYGGRVMWLGTTAILMQVFYNLAIMRYALYTGESIFVGFFRTRPGPRFWTVFYLFIDAGGYWPYLAANAAVALSAAILHRLPTTQDDTLVRTLGYVIFLASFVPLIFGGKIYNALERILVTKLVLVLGFLSGVAFFWVSWETKWEIFSGLYRFGTLPKGDFSWATLAAFAAIAGAGGLSNIAFSNYTRDKGWGMGSQVGAIPSAVGGKTITLSHTGKVFEINATSLVEWKGWLRHIWRDQVVLWAPACTIGVALPAMISYEYIRGVKTVDGNGAAAMTAQALAAQHGDILWYLMLLCGFAILFPTQIANLDGLTRRWTDVIWVGVKRVRHFGGNQVKYVYYLLLFLYCIWGLVALKLTPDPLLLTIASGVFLNFGMGFSALHVLWVTTFLMPKEVRPPVVMRIGLVCCASFYIGISCIALNQYWPDVVQWIQTVMTASPPLTKGAAPRARGLSYRAGKANATKRRHSRCEALRSGHGQSQDNPRAS